MEEERGSWDPGHSPAGGRWVGQDGEAPQANFLLQKLLCRHGWALSHPHLGSFFGGSGFFLNEILQAGFAHQKGAV